MADTPTLDQVTNHVISLGGSVRLVGDTHQLTAVAAGGILTDIAAAHGASRLEEVLRFTDPAEAAASLALRDGNPAALAFYADTKRLHPSDAATITGQVLAAWAADRRARAGRDHARPHPRPRRPAEPPRPRATTPRRHDPAGRSSWPTATGPRLVTW